MPEIVKKLPAPAQIEPSKDPMLLHSAAQRILSEFLGFIPSPIDLEGAVTRIIEAIDAGVQKVLDQEKAEPPEDPKPAIDAAAERIMTALTTALAEHSAKVLSALPAQTQALPIRTKPAPAEFNMDVVAHDDEGRISKVKITAGRTIQ